MKILVSDWRDIVRYAWSFRLIVLAGMLTGAEVLLPDLPAYFDISPRLYSVLTLVVVTAALVARIAAQRKFGNDG